jgi:hypothetical protein
MTSSKERFADLFCGFNQKLFILITGVATIFGQGGPAKIQVVPTNFPHHNILNLPHPPPPVDNFFSKTIFPGTITLQLLS